MLLVLCQEGQEEVSLRKALQRHTIIRLCGDELVLKPLRPATAGSEAFVTRLVRRAAQAASHLTVVATRSVALDQRSARLPRNVTVRDGALRALVSFQLPTALAESKLDLESVLSKTLAMWLHWNPDPSPRADVAAAANIDRWLWQFDRLGAHRWVGDRLLRALDFYATPQLLHLLGFAEHGLQRARFLCVNRRTPGKSSDVIATLATKAARSAGLGTLRIDDFYDCLETSREGVVVFAEDCLLSGTETKRLFQSLFGEVPLDRKPKTPPLTPAAREHLSTRPLELRFAVSCNLGILEIERFLQSHGLQVCTLRTGICLETLTAEGVQALTEGSLIGSSGSLRDPERHIRMVAFSDEVLWKVESQRMRAIEFCRSVGRQLWSAYLARKGWTWSPDRIEECALGMRGQALTLAFAHSVPKSTLPLFWMDGEVHYGGRRLEWKALFPNAV